MEILLAAAWKVVSEGFLYGAPVLLLTVVGLRIRYVLTGKIIKFY